jgi:hypothetical protein
MSKVKSSPPFKSAAGSKSKRIRTGCFLWVGVFLMSLIVAAVIFGPNLANLFQNGQVATGLSGPDDNTSPEAMLARRESEEARLRTYGWVDKEAGLVRIPINRAMALIAEKGLPVGTPTPTITPTPTVPPTPTSTSEVPSVETPTVESSPTAIPTPTVDLANVSFNNNVLPIFEQHCIKCHGGEQPEGGIRMEEGLKLTSYADVLAGSWNGSVIEPGNVEDSYLIEQVVSGRMPKEGPLLTPAEIEIITAWVEAGAPNN